MSESRATRTGSGAAGRRHRRRVAALAAGAALAGALLMAQPVEAGSYVVRQCSASVPGAQASWERTSNHYRAEARCGSGGGLRIEHRAARTAHGREGSWSWTAPSGTVFTRVRASASLTRHSGHAGQLRAVSTNGAAALFGGVHDAFRVHSRGGELRSFEARLRCINPSGCGAGERAHADVKGVHLRVDDRARPAVTDASGSLLAGVVRGTNPISVAASDRGGGVRRISIDANGRRLASTLQDCGALGTGVATRLVPCPRTATTTLAIATTHEALRTGPNTLVTCAEDLALAGNANRGCVRRRLWVDNTCPASARAGATLTAAFAGGRTDAVVRSDRRAWVAGRLTDEGGAPVAGATVCALSQVRRRGAAVKVAAARRTDAGGRYAIPLRPGPSRRVFVHHARAGAVVARHGLELRSRARPVLRVRAPHDAGNGDRLRFRGRLPGPACANRRVEIEAGVPKRRWQVFRSARTDIRCRFATGYTLRATNRPTAYRFRARVRAQPGYPYEPGTSAVRRQRAGRA